MHVQLVEEPVARLAELDAISIAFMVDRFFDCQFDPSRGILLEERRVESPYPKDYDSEPHERPSHWATQFDVSNWGLLSAFADGKRVGAATIAYNTSGVDMLERRSDLAVLWDIRIEPEWRGRGVGTALFQAVEVWAQSRNCRQLKIETQNINVGACKFYAAQGCELGAIHRFAYPEFPDEVMFLWYKNLT